MTRPAILAAALAAAACSDASGPSREGPDAPLFSFSPNGITYYTEVGTFNQQNLNFIIKGFDGGNPRHGDAVIATFFWRSATAVNLVDSVFDVLNDANFTPVGNTYHLIDFVSAGGISMATYVATNVQNFPDTNATPRLAVRANLSQVVTDGGVQLTSWTGVEDNFNLAFVTARHASGTSPAAQTLVGPGPITVNAGDLAYAITASSAVRGRAVLAPFARITSQSDTFMAGEVDYHRASGAETVDPQWNWDFIAPSPWLATVLALRPGTSGTNQPPVAAFASSCSTLTCTFTSSSTDPDGSIASYSWSFGDGATSTAQNPSHTYTTGGTFTVTLTVTDNQGATNAVSHTVTVAAANQPPVAAFTSSCTALTCTFTSTSSDPDGSIASYSWTFGDGGTSTVQNPSHTYTTGGTFTATLTVTDNQGATNAVSHAVTVAAGNQAPVAAFTAPCSGLTCTFNDASTDPDGTVVGWNWTSSDGASTTVQNPGSYTYAEPGTYTVTLAVMDNAGASDTTSRTVTVAPANTAPSAAFTFSCASLSCTFTSTSNDPDGTIASYSWTFGDGGTAAAQDPSHTYSTPGSYMVTLTVTDNQGATDAVTQTVTVSQANQPPTADFTFTCSGLGCSFTSASSDPDGSIASHSWTFGDGGTATAQNPSHSYSTGGSYTVTLRVTDNQGAQSTTTSKTVTVAAPNQPPTANFTFNCSALSCSFTTTSSDPDGTIASYSWTFGDGATSTAVNPSHTYTAAGSYTATLRVTDNQGAQSTTTSKTVTVSAANQPPTANFTFSCSGLSCSFTSSSSDPDGTIASYNWTFGDGGTSAVQNPSHTYTSGGTYTVMLTVTDNQGATNSSSRSVGVTPPNQPPVAAFTQSCGGLTCNFTSTSSDPDGTIASYSWTFGDATSSTLANPSHTYSAGGSYTVTLRVTDNQGAQSTTTFKTVTVTPPNQPPVASFTRSCNGLTCSFTSTSSDPDGSIATYSWTFGDGGTSTAANPSHTYTSGGTYTVTLRVTDNQGAQSATASQNVTVTPPNQPPVASFTKSCSGLTCSFTSTSSDPDGSIASYSWNFGDGTTSTAANPSHTYSAGGTYTVTLRVTDNQGAQSTLASQSVTVTAPNQPPVVNAGPDESAVTGLLYSSSFSFSDGNNNGPWSYTINWGDGSTSTGTRTGQGSFSVGHTYVIILPRSFTITVTVTDASGASGSDQKVVSVLLL